MQVKTLGRCPYAGVEAEMMAFTAARSADTPDQLWLVEHEPVFPRSASRSAATAPTMAWPSTWGWTWHRFRASTPAATPASHRRPAQPRRRAAVGRGGAPPSRTAAGAAEEARKTLRRWIRVKAGSPAVLKKPPGRAGSPSTRFYEIKKILREHKLHTVCEEASCPNIGECFGKGTATFMIMGDKCTRRCPFCDVGHGRPDPLDADEPENLARTIAALKLKYVVITSVDRDDLRDGGAAHFVECIRRTRALSPGTRIEVLVPDFRGRDDRALEILKPRRRT
jgi:hypothetical protein